MRCSIRNVGLGKILENVAHCRGIDRLGHCRLTLAGFGDGRWTPGTPLRSRVGADALPREKPRHRAAKNRIWSIRLVAVLREFGAGETRSQQGSRFLPDLPHRF
jgi:hypothetical protein